MTEPDRPPGVRPFLREQPADSERPKPPPGEQSKPPGEQTTSLRPFIITAGRVAAVDPSIGLETQVSTHPRAWGARLPPEQRAIVQLCAQPLSVAEISAKLRLHFGVTRILVGDLRAAGYLDVHVVEGDFPDPDTILRVIRGLRSLS